MSTIATPREQPRRVASVANTVTTPTSSNRPSLETSRSATGSPNPNQSNPFPAAAAPVPGRRNRAALREFYNLKKHPNPTTTHPALAGAATPPVILESADDTVSIASSSGYGPASFSEVNFSELDSEKFDADAYVKKALAENSLEELLRTYARVLGEIRALDAEKKALVYDNYSKLIAATETIRKMRANMDPLNPMASTLDPAIAQIYTQASAIRDAMRASVPEEAADGKAREERENRQRLQRLAREVLDTPERIRDLIKEGRIEDAKREWQMPRKLLETWRKKGVGGDEVLACLADGDAALRGEETGYDWRKGDDDDEDDYSSNGEKDEEK